MGNKARRLVSLVLVVGLFFQQAGLAQAAGALSLAGYLNLSESSALSQDKFRPVQMRYFSYEPASDNFKILLDKGDINKLEDKEAKEEAQTLLSYFLVGVSLPDDVFWVNLRPDSQDQIIDPLLEKTDVGRIMLEADLQLKKDTSRMTSPQTPEGKAYWDKLYKKAEEFYGHSPAQIPTITRPWIVPGEIIVRESENSAYVYKAGLKVMLEEDYLSRGGFEPAPTSGGSRTAPTHQQYAFSDPRLKELNQYSTQLIKELIIPKLTKEINSSKRYASLRQVYYSLILSRWFKLRFSREAGSRNGTNDMAGTGKSGTYSALINTRNLTNLISNKPWDKNEYFTQYQQSFAKGEYNLKEQVYTPTGQIARSYVSGGMNWSGINPENGVMLKGDVSNTTGMMKISGSANSPLGTGLQPSVAGSPISDSDIISNRSFNTSLNGVQLEIRKGGSVTIDISRSPAPNKKESMLHYLQTVNMSESEVAYFGNETSIGSRDYLGIPGLTIFGADVDQAEVGDGVTPIGVGPAATQAQLDKILADTSKSFKALGFDVDSTLLGTRLVDGKHEKENLNNRPGIKEALKQFIKKGGNIVIFTDGAVDIVKDILVNILRDELARDRIPLRDNQIVVYADGMVAKFGITSSYQYQDDATYSQRNRIDKETKERILGILGVDLNTGAINRTGVLGQWYFGALADRNGNIQEAIQSIYPDYKPVGNKIGQFVTVQRRSEFEDGTVAQISILPVPTRMTRGAIVGANSLDEREELVRSIVAGIAVASPIQNKIDDVLRASKMLVNTNLEAVSSEVNKSVALFSNYLQELKVSLEKKGINLEQYIRIDTVINGIREDRGKESKKTKFVKKLKGELVDIVDENDLQVEVTEAGFTHIFGLRHRTANAFVFTPDGKLFLQRRVHNKAEAKTFSIAGGHVVHGMTYAEAAGEELLQELKLYQIEEKLEGKLILIGQEGQFRNDDAKSPNNEFRSLYTYVLTEKEWAHVKNMKNEIDVERAKRTETEFEKWIEEEQKKPEDGLGEVWGYHVVELSEVINSENVHVTEKYSDGLKKQDVGFSKDLLLPLANGIAPIRDGTQAINPMQEIRDKLHLSSSSLSTQFSNSKKDIYIPQSADEAYDAVTMTLTEILKDYGMVKPNIDKDKVRKALSSRRDAICIGSVSFGFYPTSDEVTVKFSEGMLVIGGIEDYHYGDTTRYKITRPFNEELLKNTLRMILHELNWVYNTVLTEEDKRTIELVEKRNFLAGPGTGNDNYMEEPGYLALQETYSAVHEKMKTLTDAKITEIVNWVKSEPNKNLKGEDVYILKRTDLGVTIVGSIDRGIADKFGFTYESTSSPMQSLSDKKTGGIDFRALPMSIQPMGSFRGLDFGLPSLSLQEIERIDVESQIGQIKNMVSSGISPSGRRVKELVAACAQKGQISAYADDLLACIGDILKLEEEIAKESSVELKEALVLADLGGNYFQL